MIPAEEQIAIRMKMFEKLKSNFPWLARQEKNFQLRRLTKYNTANLQSEGETSTPSVKKREKPLQIEPFGIPSLQDLIEANQETSGNQIYLGICEDGLPLTLDLDNPAPGAILITADAMAGKTRLLRAILSSAAYLNPADDLLIFICTDQIDEYARIRELDNCQEVMDHSDKRLAYLIKELVDEIENRRSTGRKPYIILAIERIDHLIQLNDKFMFEQIYRLLKHGARNGIWIIASLSAGAFPRVDPLLLDAFRTHLIGSIADFKAMTVLAYDSTCPAQRLQKGEQFCAWINGNWLNFSICDPEDERRQLPELD